MNTRSQMRFGAILSYTFILLNIVISLLMAPFLLSRWGESGNGLYQTISPLISMLSVMDLGLGSAVIRYVSKYRAENDKRQMERFLGMVVVLYAVIGAVIAVVGVVLYGQFPRLFPNFTPEEMGMGQAMFAVLMVNMTLSMLLNIFPSVMSAYEQFAVIRGMNISRVLLRTALVVLLVHLGGTPLTIVILDTVLNIAYMVAYLFIVRLKLRVRVRFEGMDGPLLKEIFRYSFFIFLNMIMNEIYWKVDNVIIARLYTPDVVLITAYGGMLATYFMEFSNALSGMFLPRAVQMVVHGDSMEDMTDLMIRVGRIQLMVLGVIVIGFGCVGMQFLTLWLGGQLAVEKLTQVYIIALMLMLALLIPMFQNTGISIVQAMNRHAFRSVVLVVIAVLNVGVSYVLAGRWGPVGASTGTVLSLLIGNVCIINWYYYKIIGLNIPRFFGQTLRGTLPALLLATGLSLLTLLMPQTNFLWLGLRILFILAAYILSMWFIGMNASEKRLLLGLLRRVLRRTEAPDA